MCPEELIVSSVSLFCLFTAGLCLYSYRINKSFKPASIKYVSISWFNLIAIGILLGLHAASSCDRRFITWGSALAGFYFCLTVVETFTYLSLFFFGPG